MTWLISWMPKSPMPTPKTATQSGSTIASSEPKASHSTTAAAARPTISASPVPASSVLAIA